MTRILVAIAAIACFLPVGAFAQTLDPISNVFTAPGGGEFGYAVDVDGDVMVVGAPFDDGVDTNAGAAYVLGRNVGGANAWGVIKRLEPTGTGLSGDEFGASVAIDGDIVVVGARDAGSGLAQQGRVYIYRQDEGGADNWGEVKQLQATQLSSFNDFGRSVALEGDTLVVGASRDDDGGAAYIFERNQGGTDNWGPVARVAPQFLQDARFGHDVDISGDIIVVGAPEAVLGNLGGFAVPMGRAYLYGRNEGGPDNWGQITFLSASDRLQGDRFADRVSIDGDRIAVGAHLKNAVYIFERNQGGTDSWGEVVKIVGSDTTAGDEFGRDVLLQGDRLLVGAALDDDNAQDSGSVYEFDRNMPTAGGWGEVKKLQAFDPTLGDEFGFAIAADGATIVVGAHDRAMRAGAIYVTGPTPNFAPLAADQTLTIDEDTTATITLDATNTDPLTFAVDTPPQNGSLSGTAPNLTYTPDADFFGTDSFTFTADDGTLTSAPATVTIDVAAVNDAPVADDQSRATIEGMPIALVLSGSDVESDPLTFEVVGQPSSGSLAGTAPNLTYTPDAGFVGTDTFTYVANDGALDSTAATVTIQVNADTPDNRPPSADAQLVDAVAGVARAIVLTGSDPDGDGIQFTVVDQPTEGTLSGSAPNLTYTAPEGFEGTDSFTFEVSDGALTSAPATVTIEVTLPAEDNAAPEFTAPDAGESFETVVGEELTVQVEATDADGDTLTYSADGLPEGATIDAATGTVTWTPAAQGTFGVVLRVSDGLAETTRSITLVATVDDLVVTPGDTSGAADDGCGCASGGTPEPGSLLLLAALGGLLAVKRRATRERF
jgi:MYXO-CTERM domain-containing protein